MNTIAIDTLMASPINAIMFVAILGMLIALPTMLAVVFIKAVYEDVRATWFNKETQEYGNEECDIAGFEQPEAPEPSICVNCGCYHLRDHACCEHCEDTMHEWLVVDDTPDCYDSVEEVCTCGRCAPDFILCTLPVATHHVTSNPNWLHPVATQDDTVAVEITLEDGECDFDDDIIF